MDLKKIFEVSNCIQDFLKKDNLTDVQPKDLMGVLVEKGFFPQDHNEGQPLRNILRELDSKNSLYLLPQVKAERKEIYKYWNFTETNTENDQQGIWSVLSHNENYRPIFLE